MSNVTTRRKFLKGTAIAGAAAAGTLAAPSIAKAEPVNLKMPASWGGGIILVTAQSYVCRVHATRGGGRGTARCVGIVSGCYERSGVSALQ